MSSVQWKTPSSPSPKKAKVTPSSGQVMMSCFWDPIGIIKWTNRHRRLLLGLADKIAVRIGVKKALKTQ